MQINSAPLLDNLSSMRLNERTLEQSAQTIANVSNSLGEPSSEVTQELIDAIVGQIPTIIAYEANAKAVETLQAVADVLLDLKA